MRPQQIRAIRILPRTLICMDDCSSDGSKRQKISLSYIHPDGSLQVLPNALVCVSGKPIVLRTRSTSFGLVPQATPTRFLFSLKLGLQCNCQSLVSCRLSLICLTVFASRLVPCYPALLSSTWLHLSRLAPFSKLVLAS